MIALTQRPVMVDSVMAAVHLQRAYHVTVRPATIRQWAARRYIKTHGFGKLRYDLHDVERHARKRGLIA